MSKKKGKDKPIPQVRKLCVFCGGTPLTKEHLWSDWMNSVVPRDKTNYHLHTINGNFKPSKTHSVTGHALTKTFKIVCSSCNNGWMSQIESNAKAVLESLILGNNVSINNDEKESIAKWAILKTIIKEYDDLPMQAITRDERERFFLSQTPISGWRIWIAKTNTVRYKYATYHTGLGIYDSRFALTQPVKCNCQCTTFIIGKLVIYTYRSEIHDCELVGDLNKKLFPLFPQTNSSIKWDSFPELNDIDIKSLHNNLQNYFEEIY